VNQLDISACKLVVITAHSYCMCVSFSEYSKLSPRDIRANNKLVLATFLIVYNNCLLFYIKHMPRVDLRSGRISQLVSCPSVVRGN